MRFYKILTDNITIPLGLLSSIANNGGVPTVLEYFALEAFKKTNPDSPQVNWTNIQPYTFAKSQKDFLNCMFKLNKLGLVDITGTNFISKSKLRTWKGIENDSFIRKLNGNITVDFFELYSLKNNKYEDIRDYIYLGLLNSVVKGKYSRKWIEKVTGFSKSTQMTIEKRHSDKLLIRQNMTPVNARQSEQYEDKKVFLTRIDLKNKTITKTKHKYSNSVSIQQGNSYFVKEDYIFTFKGGRRHFKKSSLYKMQNMDIEVEKVNEKEANHDAIFTDDDYNKHNRTNLVFNTNHFHKFVEKELLLNTDYNSTVFLTSKGKASHFGNVLTSK